MRIVAAVFAMSLAGTAASAPAPAAHGCQISAFVTDGDPGGLNVRAAPSSAAPILGVVSNGGSGVADITGVSGSWFRVSQIVEAETGETLFRRDGWIHRSLLGLDVANEDPRLYAAPAKSAKVVARLEPDGSNVTLLGCRGAWARVRFGDRTGWLSPGGQCSSPLTTCS